MAEPILRAVSAEGYTTPTPIQSDAIPALMTGGDVLGTAQTGTGKTAAFVLPLLHRLHSRQIRPARRHCHALVLAPTRELAAQIVDSIRRYGRFLRPTTALVVGGARPGPQIGALSRGVDIVVATPGRLLDHLGSGAVFLEDTTAIVLDEADQMLDLGFLPAIRQIMAQVPAARQTALFSATMPEPIRRLANAFLNHPKTVAAGPVSWPIDRIAQSVILVDPATKRGHLIKTLGTAGVDRAIVFTRTKRGADTVHGHLQKAGFAAAAIHGNKSQGQRDRALGAFRNGGVKILVATDIAARGIDVDAVSHVVNYDLPTVPEAYVHRIGRTARAGSQGTAISFCDPTERRLLRDIERLIGSPLHTENWSSKAPATASGDSAASRGIRCREPKARTRQRREARPADEAPDAGLARMLCPH